MSGYLQRAAMFVKALGMRKTLRARERWPRSRLEEFQRERLGALAEHVTANSAFFRKHYGGTMRAEETTLENLPVTTKDQMMDDFDRYVTVPNLRRAELETHVAQVVGDDLFKSEFRVMSSSGSTGRKGLYVFDRNEWLHLLAGSLRWTEMMNVKPTLPRRTRLAAMGAPDGKHMTFRGSASIDVGLFRVLRIAATKPLPELVARLNAHQPDFIAGYPSILAMLAIEQQAGRLAIHPRVICTTSELRTEEMTARMRSAWNTEPYNALGLTETGITAVDCDAHEGQHIFEDQTILEVVDAGNRPVPPGTTGAKILVTSLYRRVQPIIRMEVSDLVSVTDAPCGCGRSFRRIQVMAGRSDDVLSLPGTHGNAVAVHPIHLRSPLTKITAIAQYQIVHDTSGLDVRLQILDGAEPRSIEQQVSSVLREVLNAQGVNGVPVRVHVVEHLEREPGAGKFKLIKSNMGEAR